MFIERHKALIITILITGIVVFGMFSLHITKQTELIAESYYEMEPLTPEEIEEKLEKEKELSEIDDSKPTTNQAFNEDKEFKEVMKNFRTVTAGDLNKNDADNSQQTESEEPEEILTSNSDYNASSGYGVKSNEKSTYSKVKDLLAMRNSENWKKPENTNANSTLTYSLKGRTMLDFDTPRYLCEESGIIIVNITVDNTGKVINTSINGSSTSKNQCLIDSATEYAESVTFDTGKQPVQVGTITFRFKGKN